MMWGYRDLNGPDELLVAALGAALVTQGLKVRRQRGHQPEDWDLLVGGQVQETLDGFGVGLIDMKDVGVQLSLDLGSNVPLDRRNGRPRRWRRH